MRGEGGVFKDVWGPDFDQKGGGRGGGGGGDGWGRSICALKLQIFLVGEGGKYGGGGRGRGGRAIGRIDVGVCYTRGARSRRWCGCVQASAEACKKKLITAAPMVP